jgi:hypothetical protein
LVGRIGLHCATGPQSAADGPEARKLVMATVSTQLAGRDEAQTLYSADGDLSHGLCGVAAWRHAMGASVATFIYAPTPCRAYSEATEAMSHASRHAGLALGEPLA